MSHRTAFQNVFLKIENSNFNKTALNDVNSLLLTLPVLIQLKFL